MVKFSREYEASIIPEWKAAFVDYKGLKKLIKRIKISRRDAAHLLSSSSPSQEQQLVGVVAGSSSYGFSVLDPVRALAARFSSGTPPARAHPEASPEREFLEKADDELEKVNRFYASQETELLARGDALIKQLGILADVKRILADHAANTKTNSAAHHQAASWAGPPPCRRPHLTRRPSADATSSRRRSPCQVGATTTTKARHMNPTASRASPDH
ncbi:hypothetical protein PR202_ga03245 [Eleusine coracana subsp. coracana]|uniref:SPX domain-containing protein n=1 Tax=Eleusine coracana subsp. coracana TaxID=191504 RepID=A0AAV5BNL6_ELECO|nr:hypothetical protein PR202_ga03245 [Eleusine coracana subsp. coracana]